MWFHATSICDKGLLRIARIAVQVSAKLLDMGNVVRFPREICGAQRLPLQISAHCSRSVLIHAQHELEQAADLSCVVHVDLLCGRNLRKTRHLHDLAGQGNNKSCTCGYGYLADRDAESGWTSKNCLIIR